MNEESIIRYLLPFVKNSGIKNIDRAMDKGAIKYSPELAGNIRLQHMHAEQVDALLQTDNFDVRRDDLIKVFYIQDNTAEYYVFIVEPLELYENDYLAGILQTN